MKKFAHIEIKEVDKPPENWTRQDGWPGPGLYRAKNGDHYLYMVTPGNVAILYDGLPEGSVINDQSGACEGITETLLLKAIAAASRAEVLRGA